MKVRVEYQGLAELNRALRKVDADLPKDLRRSLRAIAERVAVVVRQRLPQGPAAGGHIADRTRARSTQKSAGVSLRADYAGPLEFGGWPKGRPYVSEGRHVFPAAASRQDAIERELEDVLNDLIRRAGF